MNGAHTTDIQFLNTYGPSFLSTDRLSLTTLTLNDSHFILKLANTEGWIKFSRNKNITSQSEARSYIQTILQNKKISYWLVKLKGSQVSIGIVTFNKREYLEYNDIGFAFLPNYFGQGYAHEATDAVLNKLILQNNLLYILAATVPENIRSIKLLKRVGLSFEKEIRVEKQRVYVYGVSVSKLKNIRKM